MARLGYPSALALASLLFAGCSATGYAIEDLAMEINATRDTTKLLVQAGDTVKLSFPFKPDWNHEARVRPDGFASFTMIDEVQVAGMTVAELDARLTEAYRKTQGNDFAVTVDVIPSVDRATAQVVYVVGEVQRPGAIPVDGRTMTLVEAISKAGGHRKDTANLHNTILVRRQARTDQMRSWRLDAGIYEWGDKPPIFLQSGDVVFVPNTAIDDVNIWIDKYIRQNLPFPYLIPAGV